MVSVLSWPNLYTSFLLLPLFFPCFFIVSEQLNSRDSKLCVLQIICSLFSFVFFNGPCRIRFRLELPLFLTIYMLF